ncbi:MAG: hypothetical protein IJ225_06645 [Solobacterium sp.]|nr:hypothetical protein [Solobacterium sp.]
MTTALLSVVQCIWMFIGIWVVTVTLPYKGLADNFPNDVREALSPRLDHLPLSPKRIAGMIFLVIWCIGFIGIYVFAGRDGILNGFTFGQFLARYLILGVSIKLFDIIGLDYFLLTKTQFFQHYLPETKGCKGWQVFGFNRKEQIRQCIMIPIFCIICAWICTLL